MNRRHFLKFSGASIMATSMLQLGQALANTDAQDEDYKEEMYNSLLDMIEDACRKTKKREFVWHNMSGDDNYNIPLASQIRRY